MTSRAIRSGRDQRPFRTPRRKRWLIFSESQVQKRSCIIKRTDEGIVRRLVSNVPKPRALRFRVR